MSGYTKLFNSILASTIWEADMPTRIVWITLLAMKDKYGMVEASVPGLATLARVPVSEVRRALENLKAPDPDSRSKVEEGRRIRDVDGGWFVINHDKYRNLLSAEERREYLRIKQAEHRARKASTQVNTVNTSVDSIDKYTESTHTDPDTDPDQIPELVPIGRLANTDPAPSALDVSFSAFWALYPKKTGKGAALKAWKKIKPANGLCERITATLTLYCHSEQWQKDHGQFIPNPATWLNQGRWDDEPITARAAHGNGTGNATGNAAGNEPIDWYEECGLLHNHDCQLDRYKHAMRLRTDAIKAEVS